MDGKSRGCLKEIIYSRPGRTLIISGEMRHQRRIDVEGLESRPAGISSYFAPAKEEQSVAINILKWRISQPAENLSEVFAGTADLTTRKPAIEFFQPDFPEHGDILNLGRGILVASVRGVKGDHAAPLYFTTNKEPA